MSSVMETNEKDLTALSVELPEVTQEAVEDKIGLDAYLDKENETAEEAREAADKKIRQIARPRHLAGEKGRRFKGYTLEEVRYLKVVNSLKIGVVQDRLKMTFSPQMASEAKTMAGYMRSFESAMRYADVAVMVYGMFRRVRRWFGGRNKY
jgi:3-deoxy-D-manno-octulosonic acid (KDO) 8-phosphate synthase